MMSNPPSIIQRQSLHRRQNSTPVALDTMKVPQLPPTIQRQNSHRRGQSLDQSRSPIRRHRPTGSTVSITNLASTPHGQQILREAQTTNIARPGQRIDTNIPPQCGSFSAPFSPLYSHETTMNAILANSSNMQIPQQMSQSPYYPQVTMPMSAGYDGMGLGLDKNSQHYFQMAHGMENGLKEDMRRMSQPDMSMYSGSRPITPSQQMHSGKWRGHCRRI